MTYVQVTKYTQKLWRRKVWFQRILFHDSWEKWETKFFAPRGSFHGTGLLTVSSKSPYVRWRTPCPCLSSFSRYGYCSVSRYKWRLRLGLVVARRKTRLSWQSFLCSQSLGWLWVSSCPAEVLLLIQGPLSPACVAQPCWVLGLLVPVSSCLQSVV